MSTDDIGQHDTHADDDEYEKQRRANIMANAALLESLGLNNAAKKQKRALSSVAKVSASARGKAKVVPKYRQELKPRERVPKRRTAIEGAKAWRKSMQRNKRRTTTRAPSKQTSSTRSSSMASPDDSDSSASSYDDSEGGGLIPQRTSTRLASRQSQRGRWTTLDDESDEEEEITPHRQRRAQRMGERVHEPKTFGHIPGIPIGTHWQSRIDCSTDAVHAPTVAGISGSSEEGCWSIALSGGYEDDVDEGQRFTFTGSGGRQLKGRDSSGKNLNLRTAPQSFNQSFTDPRNAAIVKSCETGKPIRVVRGFKGTSQWSPPEGYVYSGLYRCVRSWKETGQSGFEVCKFEFVRSEGQAPLPTFGSATKEGALHQGIVTSPQQTREHKAVDKGIQASTPSAISFLSKAHAQSTQRRSLQRSRTRSLVEVLI